MAEGLHLFGLFKLLMEHAANGKICLWNTQINYYRYVGLMTYRNSAKHVTHEEPKNGHEVLKGQGFQLDKVCISQKVKKDKVCISQTDEE